MKLTMIAAIGPDRLLGRKDGSLPWKNKAEMAWFKKNTDNALVLMGHSTFKSMGSRGLKGRFNMILSSRFGDRFKGPEGSVTNTNADRDRQEVWVHSVEGALAVIRANVETGTPAFVIGGAQVYRLLFPHCSDLLLSRITDPVQAMEGDVRFPHLPASWFHRGPVMSGEGFLAEHWVQAPREPSRRPHEVTAEVKASNWRAIQSGRDLLHELEEAKRDILRASQCKVEVPVERRRSIGDPGFTAGDTLDWS